MARKALKASAGFAVPDAQKVLFEDRNYDIISRIEHTGIELVGAETYKVELPTSANGFTSDNTRLKIVNHNQSIDMMVVNSNIDSTTVNAEVEIINSLRIGTGVLSRDNEIPLFIQTTIDRTGIEGAHHIQVRNMGNDLNDTGPILTAHNIDPVSGDTLFMVKTGINGLYQKTLAFYKEVYNGSIADIPLTTVAEQLDYYNLVKEQTSDVIVPKHYVNERTTEPTDVVYIGSVVSVTDKSWTTIPINSTYNPSYPISNGTYTIEFEASSAHFGWNKVYFSGIMRWDETGTSTISFESEIGLHACGDYVAPIPTVPNGIQYHLIAGVVGNSTGISLNITVNDINGIDSTGGTKNIDELIVRIKRLI